MRTLKVVNATRGTGLGDRVWLADNVWTRLRGLIGRGPLTDGMGLMIVPCRGIHMYGMTYPIDVAFIDEGREIVAMYRELAPGARSKWHAASQYALELPPGKLAESNTEVGDHLEWTEKEAA